MNILNTADLNTSLLTINQAADFLNIKVSRLRTAIFKKEIPFIKIGRLVRFDIEDLTNWIEELKETTLKQLEDEQDEETFWADF